MIKKQDIIPHAKLMNQRVQVGQPDYPDGVLVSGEFEVEGHHWDRPWWRLWRWRSRPKTFQKKVAIRLDAKAVEAIIGEWTDKWETFETWSKLIAMKTDLTAQHRAYHAELFGEEE